MNKEIKQQIKSEFKMAIENLTGKVSLIQKAVEEIKKTGLNEDILFFAIQRSAQKFNKKYTPVSIADIRAIVSGINALESYMFPEEDERR